VEAFRIAASTIVVLALLASAGVLAHGVLAFVGKLLC
jgi:hypothetical protein